jgi:hypothetical protein
MIGWTVAFCLGWTARTLLARHDANKVIAEAEAIRRKLEGFRVKS